MNALFLYSTTALAAYLIGAIPFGFLVARMRGIDIRTVGSRNIGATNVFRSVGKGWGILTLLLDLAKGWVGAAIVPLLAAGLFPANEAVAELRLCGGVCAVIGHTWPVYLGFRGGKGVATSAGMLLGVAPQAAGVALAGWIITFLLGRYVSLASMTAALILGVAIWLEPFRPVGGWLTPVVLTLIAVLIIVRHRSNLARLRAGTETRLSLHRRTRASHGDAP
jgi:glycerol-3-phosphate acyltransferase PlsY